MSDLPSLRAILDRGDDPARFIGGFDELRDIAVGVGMTAIEARPAAAIPRTVEATPSVAVSRLSVSFSRSRAAIDLKYANQAFAARVAFVAAILCVCTRSSPSATSIRSPR